MVKNPTAVQDVQETQDRSLRGADPLEKKTATQGSIRAGRTPGPEEPGGLQSMGYQESDRMAATEHIQNRKYIQ